MRQKFTNLEEMLDQLGKAVAEDQDKIPVGKIVAAVGSRSFGPLLLLAGIILFSPLSGIPGMPTTMGGLVLIISGQLLARRDHIWLPQWLLKRSVPRSKLEKSLKWLRPPARFIDRLLRPRLRAFLCGPCRYSIALICVLIAVFMPVMELVPFSASSAGAVLTCFGLSLIAHDGLLALVAFTLAGITIGLLAYHFL